MSDQPNARDEPRLYDLLHDEGKAWLGEIVDAFNAGGYAEIAKKVAEDEAAVERDLAG